jgi:hypothetical protein
MFIGGPIFVLGGEISGQLRVNLWTPLSRAPTLRVYMFCVNNESEVVVIQSRILILQVLWRLLSEEWLQLCVCGTILSRDKCDYRRGLDS